MLEIRPATPDEMPEFGRVVGTALARPPSDFRDLRPEWTLCAFEDDRLATAYAAWPLQMRLNGRAVPIAAVTTVSTAPVYRRHGLLRQITTRHFRRLYKQRGQPIAALYASLAAIYQRYGYGIISTHHRYAIEPRYIQFSEPPSTSLQGRKGEERSWGTPPDPRPSDERSVGGRLSETAPNGGNNGPRLSDEGSMGGRLREASRQREFGLLVELYRRFREERTGPGPEAVGNRHSCVGPGSGRLPTADCPRLARIVDLERALTARPYPVGARLRFALTDDLCPWNSGAWQLETGAEESRVTHLPDGAGVDLSLGPNTLAMLLFGQISATEAARMGCLDLDNGLDNEPSLARWDAALRTKYRPFSADHW